MSLLRQAKRHLENQQKFKVLNAFVARHQEPLQVLAAIQQADDRTSNGQAKSDIDGQLVAIKDNICTLKYPTTCGSNILNGFQSPYAATVVRKLEAAGAVVVGKTNLDEFGMGSHSTNSIFGPVRNSRGDAEHPLSAGGSSGGSAVAVASKQCWAALGTDTGGSVRLPAAYTGLVGFKPSYGIVSRYGVVPYANSLDTVGVLALTSSVAKQVFDTIKGHDDMDPTSLSVTTRGQIEERIHSRPKKSCLTIGVPTEYNIAELEPRVLSTWLTALHLLKAMGHSVCSVSLPATKLALPAYYVLAPAEASSNLAKYDGVRYGSQGISSEGPKDVLYADTRGQGLGEEVKRRILLGAYSLSASAIDNYFIQAQKVRRMVQQDFDSVFTLSNPLLRQSLGTVNSGGVDVLLSPTAPSTPPRLADLANRTSVDTYRDDVLTVPASLAGLPALSVPVHGNPPGFEIGLQITAQYGDDDSVFRAAQILEELKDDRIWGLHLRE